MPLVCEELRREAHGQKYAERSGHNPNTTALVNEACVKLMWHPPRVQWQSRIHLFADVSAATVKRDWTTARPWLYREVRESLP